MDRLVELTVGIILGIGTTALLYWTMQWIIRRPHGRHRR
jgi:hypothetical protein